MDTGLAPGFLIAAPGLVDPHFARTVVLMAEHTSEGAVGFIVNRPTEITLEELLRGVDEGLAEAVEGREVASMRVLIGGPVQRHVAWVLYRRERGEPVDEGAVTVGEHLVLGASMELLRSLVQGERQGPFHVLLGYSGWGNQQLEGEIATGSWLPMGLEGDLTFEVPMPSRWDEAVRRLGLVPGGFMMGGPGAQA